MRSGVMIVLWCCMAGVASAQQTRDSLVVSKARQSALAGAVGGGATGGLLLGLFAIGICDAADCSGSFAEGFLPGAAIGAVLGGTIGLALGSMAADSGTMLEGNWRAGAGAAAQPNGWSVETLALKRAASSIRAGLAIGLVRPRARADQRVTQDPVFGTIHYEERASHTLLTGFLTTQLGRGREFLELRSGLYRNWTTTIVDERDASGAPARAGYNRYRDDSWGLGAGAGIGYRFDLGRIEAATSLDWTALIPLEDVLSFASLQVRVMRR